MALVKMADSISVKGKIGRTFKSITIAMQNTRTSACIGIRKCTGNDIIPQVTVTSMLTRQSKRTYSQVVTDNIESTCLFDIYFTIRFASRVIQTVEIKTRVTSSSR